jgi:hypothetical protein
MGYSSLLFAVSPPYFVVNSTNILLTAFEPISFTHQENATRYWLAPGATATKNVSLKHFILFVNF